MLTKERCDKLLDQINEKLIELGKEQKLSIYTRGGKFTDHGLMVKLEIMEINESGEAHTFESETFRDQAPEFGLEENDLWKTFTRKNVEYRVIGLMPRRKRPVVVKRTDDGREYLMSLKFIKKILSGEKSHV